MDKIGEEFCNFFMCLLQGEFKKFPGNIKLNFCLNDSCQESIICEGKKTEWEDVRLCAKEKKINARWLFLGENSDRGLYYFLEMILEELEGHFKNILHLEELEKQIKNAEKPSENGLVKALLRGMLNRELMVERFIKKVIKEKELPSLEFLIQISAQRYEQRAATARIYFTKEKCNGSLMFIRENASEEWKLKSENLRAIRKMMEMAGNDSGLLAVNEGKLYSMAGVISTKTPGLPTICVVITGHLSWEVWEKEQVLFEYREGIYRIPVIEGGEKDEKWKEELQSLLNQYPEWGIEEETVEGIVELLKGQEHGTSIVFMEKGMLEKEKIRFLQFKRAYVFEKPFLPILERKDENEQATSVLEEEYKNKMMGLSAIDGAIMADAKGECHIVGAILDGELVIEGRSDRGARYNSILNYVNWVYEKHNKKGWCFAFVLSEDKTVDLTVPKQLFMRI